ncbi:hypothetical protein ACFW04_012168 [Cataglyphis niger]
MNNGLYTLWVQCPLNAALKVANLKKIKIGWTLARVDLLDNRLVQCFKCWKYGHVRLACPSKEDFTGLCFKCGRKGHLANKCSLPPFCKVCDSEGKNSDHRLGSYTCKANQKFSTIKTNFRRVAVYRARRLEQA